MIWRNPWAWLGLSALAVPILVHLLGRRRPTPVAFPTLRFFLPSRVLPARRHRITDVPLLLVRLAIVALAVAALAQPVFVGMPAGSSSTLIRAIVVDTSTSLNRGTPDGRLAIDVARERAKTFATEASASRTVETTSIRGDLPAVASWLSAQPGRREIIVISDFQTGAITREDLAPLPAGIGVRLDAVDVPAVEAVSGAPIRVTGRTLVPKLNVTADSTRVEWQPGQPIGADIELHAAAADAAQLAAARDASLTEGLRTSDALGRIVVIFPGAPDWPQTMERLGAIDQPWMFEVVARIRTNETLQDAIRRLPAENQSATSQTPAAPTVVLRSREGRVRLSAAVDRAGTVPRRLLLFADVALGDLAAPALLTAIARAASDVSAPDAELEPTRVPDALLRQWERAPGISTPPGDLDRTRSDGRWFWLAALVALALETWMRRRPAAATDEVTHARVA